MAKTLSNLIRSGSANTPLPVSFGGTGLMSSGNTGNALISDGTNWVSSSIAQFAFPTQTGNNGKYLTTDGINASWSTVVALPTQTGNNGKYLTTDGTNATWGSISGGASITNDTTTNFNYTIPMSNVVSGTWATAYIANTKLYFNPSTGTLYSTLFQALSDKTVKNNIITISNGLSTINALNGVEFTWKETGKPSAGVIAQELESILPALVTENEGIKSVNYLGIIGYLIEAVKELSSKIEKLENR